ncbi:SGNH/GDSL hydrolase family protein [Lutibacter sp.]|uniref:SGNH/GDSL hydrolase family protein n=1 Tax=Lutibacter sp. TaxID=1925666 RepID=UPI001A2D308E|nr:SGNH/GDSL hydrolase family protein [Lutibacter sp.]MBI9042208.1 SGNH/GDSL hydrolase family protein [Lutibacter sp.]
MEFQTQIAKNYLALGDSYTIGESVAENERFPMILVNDLNAKNYLFNTPKIVAKTGWTTGELKEAILKENIQNNYDVVTLLIGVNNQYRGYDLEEFRTEFAELLNMAITFAKKNTSNVVVVSIPDWSVSPFAKNRDRTKISAEIDAFNTIKKEETLKRNVKFIDITPISRLGLNNNTYFASDGLHFSGSMHQLWVNEIIQQNFNK